MPFVGCIRFVDADECSREYSYLVDVADLDKLHQFCVDIAPVIGCTADKLGMTETRYISITGAAEGLITEHLQVICKENATGGRRGFMIPAPSHDMFDHIQGVGKRLKPSYGVQLTQSYSTLIGVPCTFVSGALVGPR